MTPEIDRMTDEQFEEFMHRLDGIAAEKVAAIRAAPEHRHDPEECAHCRTLVNFGREIEQGLNAEVRAAWGIEKEARSRQPDCTCEGEFTWACGPECDCFHHGGSPPVTDEQIAREIDELGRQNAEIIRDQALMQIASPPQWDESHSIVLADGRMVIAQSDTDPGDMGEPRVFDSDGVTYVTVPSFEFWARLDDPPPDPGKAEGGPHTNTCPMCHGTGRINV